MKSFGTLALCYEFGWSLAGLQAWHQVCREKIIIVVIIIIIIIIIITIIMIILSSSVFCPSGQVLHCKLRHQGCNSAQRQVFHCKLRNLGCSFTRDE